MFKILDQNSDWLESKGYFVVGDSAYPLMGHLLVPYADAKSLSPEDAFNFWLRIQYKRAEPVCSGSITMHTTH